LAEGEAIGIEVGDTTIYWVLLINTLLTSEAAPAKHQ
jgi:hypothetical protein